MNILRKMNDTVLLAAGLGLSFLAGTSVAYGIVLVAFPGCANAASRNVPMMISASALSPVVVVDGDTIKIDGVTIRIVEIDTPETYRSRCENELVLGLKAKERLRALLDSGPVTYEATGTDRYRRTLAKVYAGGVNVGKVLLDEGFALAYQPGGAAKLRRLQAWCGPDARLDY